MIIRTYKHFFHVGERRARLRLLTGAAPGSVPPKSESLPGIIGGKMMEKIKLELTELISVHRRL